MKKVFLFVVLAALVMVSCTDKRAYTVTGKFATSDFDGKTVYLQERDYSQHKLVSLDSTVVKGDQFEFKGIASDTPAVLLVRFSSQYQPAVFVAEAGNIQLAIDSTIVSNVSGTQTNDNLQQFSNQIDQIFEEGQTLYSQTMEELQSGKIDQKEAESRRDASMNKLKDTIYGYIKSSIQSPLGEYLLMDYSYYLDPEQNVELISMTSPVFQSFEDVKMMKKRAEAQIASSAGKPFVDIKGKDFDGKEISLSDYVGKGNVVLLDFWASWCGPCIRSLPGLIQTYQKFQNKGLTIVGFSLDGDGAAWKAATEKHQIPWSQFSNLKGWEDESALTYGINSIPATVLIGKDGIIIERNLEADALNAKLEKLLK